MANRSNRHSVFRIILALVFVVFGLVALGNNLGWWNIDDLFLEWWPMILVLIGLVTIFAPGGSWGGGIFLIFLGIIFLLHSHGIYDISDLLWPALLMMVGIIIWPRKNRSSAEHGDNGNNIYSNAINDEHVFNINTILTSRRESFRNEQLAGGHGTAVLGNLELDLRQVQPRDGAYIETTAVFGNIIITVPADWKIEKLGSPVFGRVDDRRNNINESGITKKVSIEMNAVFGKIELKN